jgi:hypothetical protein
VTQQRELGRVRTAIVDSIIDFAIDRGTGNSFHMEELRDFVRAEHSNIAPDSPGRILRDLRQDNVLNYRVISRSQSLYEFTPGVAA